MTYGVSGKAHLDKPGFVACLPLIQGEARHVSGADMPFLSLRRHSITVLRGYKTRHVKDTNSRYENLGG